jgi:4-alpha-glucanotransferase
MQFGYDGPPTNLFRLENHPRGSVVYVGTHDCDTALGWWRTLPRRIKRASALPGVEPHWELIEATLSSRAELAILQAQDVLGLGSESRMNSPGTTTGNWSWRLQPRQLTKKHAARLRGLTEEASRLR